MTTVATRPKRRKKAQQEETPDLFRDAGIFSVSVTYLPNLENAKTAFVSIQTNEGAMIDSFEVPPEKGPSVLHHPTIHSDKLHAHIRGG